MPAFGTLGNIEQLWEKVQADNTLDGYQRSVLEITIRATFFEHAIEANYGYANSSTVKTLETKRAYQRFCAASINLAKNREAAISPKQVSW